MAPGDHDKRRYDPLTIVLHWVTALLTLVLWAGAKSLDLVPAGALRADARSLHIVLGIALGALGGGRFVWRLSFGRPLPETGAGLMGLASKAAHAGLYALLAVMVGVGMLLAWTGGDSFFGQFAAPSPDANDRDLARGLQQLHGLIGWLIVALVGVHSGAALVHQYVLRDGLLNRMWPGRRA